LQFLLEAGNGLQRQLLQRPRNVREVLHGRDRLREVLPQVVSGEGQKNAGRIFSAGVFLLPMPPPDIIFCA
jgi:hypothetical protein